MRLLARSFLRFFARTPWTTLTALFGVSLGVASTVAVHLISLSVADALDANRLPHLQGVTHLADRRDATMVDYFELRRLWRSGQLPGVLGLVPIVEGQVVDGGRRFHVVGADWFALYGLPGERAQEGFQPGSIVLDAGLGLGRGDALRLGGETWPVAGALDSGVADGLFADIGDALLLLQSSPRHLSHVGVAMQDRWGGIRFWLESLLPGLSAGLPEGPRDLQGWNLRPVSGQQPGAALANSILFNLGALGSLALLVAWFLIYQVCVLWLRRQAPVLEGLFALGASRVELAACFLCAVAALGALATLAGTAGGVLLADLLTGVSTAGLNAAPLPQLSPAVVVKALVSGLGVSVVGAVMAFYRWRRSARAGARGLWWLFGVAAAAALIATGVGLEQTGLFGGFAAILAAALLTASLVTPLLRALRRGLLGNGRTAAAVVEDVPATPGNGGPGGGGGQVVVDDESVAAREAASVPTGRAGLLARLALREATWFEADVGTALGALVLAVATSAGLGLMVDSFKLDFERMLSQRLAYEYFVELPRGEVFTSVQPFAKRWPQAGIQAYGSLRTRIDGHSVEIGHSEFSAAEAARYGHARALRADEGIASESLLMALGIAVGDSVEVGGARLRIAAQFPDFGAVTPRLLMHDEAVSRRFGKRHFTGVGISGVAALDLEAWLAAEFPEATLQPRERARARALEIFDRSFAITNALTLLALTVAVAGLYNAMLGLRLNRKATGRLLTALGLSAAEDRYIELVRALGLGALAMLLALPLGLAMGAILCEVINPRAFGWSIEMSISGPALAGPVLLGLLAVIAAALAPSPGERGTGLAGMRAR